MTIHPMLRDQRPLIATRPIEAYADAIKVAIEDGYQGIQVKGRSRDGKSQASKYLIAHPSWIENFVMMPKVTMERRTNTSDTQFYMLFQKKLKLTQHVRSGATNRVSQIADHIIAECMARHCRGAIMFIDEAQWMTNDDYEYLTNIDNSLDDAGFRLFCVFINQTDDAKAEEERRHKRLATRLPPHVSNRYFSAQHIFTGLQGVSDIAHALDQYDRFMTFDNKTFTEYFAPHAYGSGWRAASHANDFVNAISSIRKRNGLHGNSDLAMKVFDITIYRLLARMAPQMPNFTGFDQTTIEQVMTSPYVQLEVARQRQSGA